MICECGKTMNIKLRTLLYQEHVEIFNVPIFSCDICKQSKVLDEVKPNLRKLIKSVDPNGNEKERFEFQEVNELSFLLFRASDKAYLDESVEGIIEERINELLDLLLLSQSLGDEKWKEDARGRLMQISKLQVSAY